MSYLFEQLHSCFHVYTYNYHSHSQCTHIHILLLYVICIVDIREIKEVREGIGSKDFERQPEELRKLDQFCCFVIYYGTEFKLKTLSVAGEHTHTHTSLFPI